MLWNGNAKSLSDWRAGVPGTQIAIPNTNVQLTYFITRSFDHTRALSQNVYLAPLVVDAFGDLNGSKESLRRHRLDQFPPLLYNAMICLIRVRERYVKANVMPVRNVPSTTVNVEREEFPQVP